MAGRPDEYRGRAPTAPWPGGTVRLVIPTPTGPARPEDVDPADVDPSALPGFGLLAQAVEDAPTLSAVLAGPQLRLVLQNRASRELLGPRRLGAPLAEVFPESASSAAGMLEVMRTGRTWQDERRVDVRDVDGQELVLRWVV